MNGYANRAERRSGPRSERKQRRALGLYSPINLLQYASVPAWPRYARRHMDRITSMATRRQRKWRARTQRVIDRRWR